MSYSLYTNALRHTSDQRMREDKTQAWLSNSSLTMWSESQKCTAGTHSPTQTDGDKSSQRQMSLSRVGPQLSGKTGEGGWKMEKIGYHVKGALNEAVKKVGQELRSIHLADSRSNNKPKDPTMNKMQRQMKS